jgi:hypothetical protein
MVSVLAIGSKVLGFKPGGGDGFSRAIKIRITPSFGGEVKLSAPCSRILRHVKRTSKYEHEYTSKAKIVVSFARFLLMCY